MSLSTAALLMCDMTHINQPVVFWLLTSYEIPTAQHRTTTTTITNVSQTSNHSSSSSHMDAAKCSTTVLWNTQSHLIDSVWAVEVEAAAIGKLKAIPNENMSISLSYLLCFNLVEKNTRKNLCWNGFFNSFFLFWWNSQIFYLIFKTVHMWNAFSEMGVLFVFPQIQKNRKKNTTTKRRFQFEKFAH